MLSHFFKKEVIFSFSKQHDWTIVRFYTQIPKWKNAIKDTIGILCADNLYFDDYIPGRSDTEVQVYSIHADIVDLFIEFLSHRHGFTQGHSDIDQNLLNQFDSKTIYHKKVTEKQFYAFLNDLEKMQIVPSTGDIENGIFEHIKRFDQF